MTDRALAPIAAEPARGAGGAPAEPGPRGLPDEAGSGDLDRGDGPGLAAPARLRPRLRAPGRPLAAAPQPPLREHPPFSALAALGDPMGIWHRTVGIVPDRRAGYRLDDNAGALVLAAVAHGLGPNDRQAHLLTYAAFVESAWDPQAGTFRAALGFERVWQDAPDAEDVNGRAIWALGRTAAEGHDRDIRAWAIDLYDRALPALAAIDSPGGLAFLVLGAAAMSRQRPEHRGSARTLATEGELVAALLDASRRPDWAWFDAVLGPEAPRLAQALIEAGEALARPDWIDLGLESLAWAAGHQTDAAGGFRPAAGRADGPARSPIDRAAAAAHAAIEASVAAWRVSGEPRWRAHAERAWTWFVRPGDCGRAPGDLASGRCRGETVAATLAFQLAHHAMRAFAAPATGYRGVAGGRNTGRSTPGRTAPVPS
ncbi:MAG: hypothetical protein ACEQR8_01715 [Cypionkella sp.]